MRTGTLLADVGQVLFGAQLAIGNVEEIGGADDLPQHVPGLDVGLIVGDVAVVDVVVHGHRAVAADRDRPDQLLEIVPQSSGRCRSALRLKLRRGRR